MAGTMQRSWAATAATLGAAVVLSLTAPAGAEGPVVVRGTAFPSPLTAGLSHVGCASLHDRGTEVVQPYVSQGPGTPPLGARSLKYDLAGGSAMGALSYVSSVRGPGASLSVHAEQGTTGVAYVGYQAPADRGTDRVWFGRADLAVGAGAWQRVDAGALAYRWTLYDVGTGRVLAAGPDTPLAVATFTALRGGDGPGMWTIGFGCDGRPFNVDAFTLDGTTYDLEGLRTTLGIASTRAAVTAGEEVRVDGGLEVHGGSLPFATVILERRAWGETAWTPIRVADAVGVVPSVHVQPPRRTEYRWRFVDRPLAEGSTSAPLVVDVARRVEATWADGRITGTVAPARAGVPVRLHRSGAWQPVATTVTDAEGRFALDVPAPARGTYRVHVPAGDGNLAGASAPLAAGDGATTPPVTPSSPPPSPPSTPSTPPATPPQPSSPSGQSSGQPPTQPSSPPVRPSAPATPSSPPSSPPASSPAAGPPSSPESGAGE
ncbi:hypothetical protein [Nocardioides sp. SYSU D00038]|uniref:hypothetical protein n=1 Tax=Nocardioides sp. SYSU D00038 TaxID=2812554 RepID=UPI0019670C2D|nr:hypothetical protein [Nocardioides sp. SYSU D00038]